MRDSCRDASEFARRVYRIVAHIPEGRVLTYGDVAALAGRARAARAVGALMRASLQRAPDLPWHRVINARGAISARSEIARPLRQYERLQAEGVSFDASGRCDLPKVRWPMDEAWSVTNCFDEAGS